MDLLKIIGLMLLSFPITWVLWRLARDRSCEAIFATIISYFMICTGIVIWIKEVVPTVQSPQQLVMIAAMFLGAPGTLILIRWLARRNRDKNRQP